MSALTGRGQGEERSGSLARGLHEIGMSTDMQIDLGTSRQSSNSHLFPFQSIFVFSFLESAFLFLCPAFYILRNTLVFRNMAYPSRTYVNFTQHLRHNFFLHISVFSFFAWLCFLLMFACRSTYTEQRGLLACTIWVLSVAGVVKGDRHSVDNAVA